MINPTVTGWQETWFGRYSAELTRYDMDPACEIGFKIQQEIEFDIAKIVRNVMLQNLEPLTYKEVEPLVKNLYFAFDPDDQVQWKGQRIYKAKGDLADWEKQLMHEFWKLEEERKIKSEHKRYCDADELLEHVWREKLDSRELIADLVERMVIK